GFNALKYASKLLKGKPELQIRDFIGEESSRIYDSSGHLLTEIGTYYRENIRYKDCPESLVDAFLSIEDSRYFEHNGFDIPRFTMAAVETLARHNTQGGSTFTMQLVKNTYFTIDAGDESVSYDASYEYKAQQIWLAMELEQYLNKKEIFELYVNKLNFGARVRGLEKAAQYYFNKHAREMNLSESALLAGIVNLPNQYNPYAYLEDATNRRNGVLRLMLNHGYITEKEYKLARSIRVEDLLVGEQNMKVETTSYPAYIDVVIQEAQELTGYDPVLKGMDIYTALVPEIQERIEYLLTDESGIPYTNDRLQVSILSMNHHDGTIVGVGGGRNYTGGARLLNRATQQFVQPGSSLKPIISYALGFEYLGFSADEILEDRPITYPGETRVLENATNNYVGDIYIKDAISMSLNIPAILTLQKVTNKIGVNAVVDYLNNLGLSRVNVDNYHLSVAIGGNDFVVTPKQNAGAHAAIMNLGVYNEPHTITRLVMSDGSVFYPKNQNRRVLSSGSSYLITQFMKNNVDVNFFNFSNELKHSFPVYAKTGTTDWGSDGLQYGIPQGAAKEKWIVASSSMLTTAIWMGYDYAEAGQPSYLDNYTINLNIPGRIHNSLLDLQEEIYTPEQLAGVQQPADVQDITYVRGTLPHVMPENWMPQSALVTSQVSQTGIENNPMVTADEYTNGEDTLNYFTVGTAGGTLS
ncbi:MAG: transglycosylase domain-containing protein, partial [Solobacterium sp.]|nr:transglycosylase domain-containing protein [Solobacterium sp.]